MNTIYNISTKINKKQRPKWKGAKGIWDILEGEHEGQHEININKFCLKIQKKSELWLWLNPAVIWNIQKDWMYVINYIFPLKRRIILTRYIFFLSMQIFLSTWGCCEDQIKQHCEHFANITLCKISYCSQFHPELQSKGNSTKSNLNNCNKRPYSTFLA